MLTFQVTKRSSAIPRVFVWFKSQSNFADWRRRLVQSNLDHPKDTCNWCSSTNSEFQEKIKSSLAGVDSRDFWYDGPWDNFVLHRRKRNRIKSRGVKFPWGGHSRCYWTFVWHTTRIAQGDCLQSNGCPCLSKMGVSLDLKAEQTVYRFQNLLFLSVQLKNRLKCWLIFQPSIIPQKRGILGMAGYMCLVLTSVCDTY